MRNPETIRSRSRRALSFGFLAFSLLWASWMSLRRAAADGGSLFPVRKAARSSRGSRSTSAASLFTDVRARSEGDILTITVSESTTAQSTANTKVAKDESVSGFAGSGLFNRLFHELGFSANNSRAANGAGSTTRSGTLITTLSVRVVEILESGNLRVEGTRVIGINKETQKVTFGGIIRPEDISLDNSVSSSLVADLAISYDGKGMVGDTQRPGILTRIFRFLF